MIYIDKIPLKKFLDENSEIKEFDLYDYNFSGDQIVSWLELNDFRVIGKLNYFTRDELFLINEIDEVYGALGWSYLSNTSVFEPRENYISVLQHCLDKLKNIKILRTYDVSKTDIIEIITKEVNLKGYNVDIKFFEFFGVCDLWDMFATFCDKEKIELIEDLVGSKIYLLTEKL
jgi:hypothetical protein